MIEKDNKRIKWRTSSLTGSWTTTNHPHGRNEKDNRRIEWRTSSFTSSWTTRNHPHGRNELEQNLPLHLIKGS